MPDNPLKKQAAPAAPLNLLADLLLLTRKAGAEAGDAVLFQTIDVQMSCRHGKPEGIERSESAGLGLRAWVGKKQAIVSSTDITPSAFPELAQRVVAMASAATEDADSTLADPALLAADIPELELAGGPEPDAGWLLEQCRQAEAAAMAEAGITNSEGADGGYSASTIALVTMPTSGAGFAGAYGSSYVSLSVSVLAGEGTAMERDYDYASVRHAGDLPTAESLGKNAAARALKRLNPRPVKTCEAPVMFDPRVGRGLLSSLAGAINGAAIARGTSFLKDAMGTAIFAPGVTIIDDPHRKRGLGSRPFDAEGVRTEQRALVEEGVLASWLLDTRSASKLGLESTGHASRGLASAPSPSSSNLHMQAGEASPRELMGDIKSGLYVTETFGMGVNLVTGDYSQGASGFWIENGEITYPVSGLTIAGHLRDMFKALTPANDLEFRYATNAPTFRIARMTIAGE